MRYAEPEWDGEGEYLHSDDGWGGRPTTRGRTRMTDDLVSVQILAAFGSAQDRDLLRQAAGTAAVPVDIVEAANVGSACSTLAAKDIDVAFVDASTAAAELEAFIAAARSARRQPFIVLVAAGAGEFKASGATVDGIVANPTASSRRRS